MIGVFRSRCGPSPAPTTQSRLRRTFSPRWRRGRITPAEAEAVAKLLHNFIAASELREFERRLEALEAASARRP